MVTMSARAKRTQPTDEALLVGMAQGDESATVAFVRRYQARVFGLARSILIDAAVAEDVAQEALLRVWRFAPVFDSRRASVTTWVLTITHNLAVDALRMRRSTPVDPDDLVALGLVAPERSPEDTAVALRAVPRLRAALAALPPEQSRAVVLSGMYGRTAAEIGEDENVALGTAKTRIRAGLMKLRNALDDGAVAEMDPS
jgi:RNA polymerase sigma factor (sigma-70 family)